MNVLLQLFRDLILLKRGPQDLPHSPALLGGLILADLVVSLGFVQAIAPKAGQNLAGVALLQLSLLLGLPYVVLQLARRTARFNQTASALVGVDLVFTLLAIPLLLGIAPAAGQSPNALQSLLALAAIALVSWQLVVRGHILRHALELSLAQGVLIALIFFLFEQLLLASLQPAAPPT
jgi:uncharacterized membrane protein YjgN (DUF898 family)